MTTGPNCVSKKNASSVSRVAASVKLPAILAIIAAIQTTPESAAVTAAICSNRFVAREQFAPPRPSRCRASAETTAGQPKSANSAAKWTQRAATRICRIVMGAAQARSRHEPRRFSVGALRVRSRRYGEFIRALRVVRIDGDHMPAHDISAGLERVGEAHMQRVGRPDAWPFRSATARAGCASRRARPRMRRQCLP